MGIKSTHYLTRETANQILMSKVYSMSDREMEYVLEGLKESEYRNYRIGDTSKERNFVINNVEDFNEF